MSDLLSKGAAALQGKNLAHLQSDAENTLPDSTSPILSVKSLSCGYANQAVIKDVSFEIYPGEILVIFGPNGVGKSTLFKTLLGFLPKIEGTVCVDGENIFEWSRKRIAQNLAYVPQSHITSFGFSVREMVLMGRTPMMGSLATPTHEDEEAAALVLEDLGIAELAERNCTTLSGGELQMVLIARALAQKPRLLIMDEPCASLDLGNQVLVLNRIIELAERGLSIIVTTHDPNHAFLLDSKVVCLQGNGDIRVGWARELITQNLLKDLYGIQADIGVINTGSNVGNTAGGSVVENNAVGHTIACVPRLKIRTDQNMSQKKQNKEL